MICGAPIKLDQVEFEIQFAHDGAAPGVERFHVHLRCFAAREFERGSPGAGSAAVRLTTNIVPHRTNRAITHHRPRA